MIPIKHHQHQHRLITDQNWIGTTSDKELRDCHSIHVCLLKIVFHYFLKLLYDNLQCPFFLFDFFFTRSTQCHHCWTNLGTLPILHVFLFLYENLRKSSFTHKIIFCISNIIKNAQLDLTFVTFANLENSYVANHGYDGANYRPGKGLHEGEFRRFDEDKLIWQIKDAVRFVRRSTKPDKKEFQKIAFATGLRFYITMMWLQYLSCRIPDYGIHWLLCQAHPHPNQ